MNFVQVMNQFYFSMALSELRIMKENSMYNNLTYNSMRYLDLIVCTENCTVSRLAELLHVSKPAVTIKVNELCALGLVEKVQSARDRRIHYLTVRPKVAEEYARYDRMVVRAAERMENKYTKQEIGQFCRMMADFIEFYQEGEQHG